MHDLEGGAKSRLILRPELLSQEEVALHRSSLVRVLYFITVTTALSLITSFK